MHEQNDQTREHDVDADIDEKASERRDYEAPKLTKKRSVARVTLFSGGGATAGGLTAAG